MMTAVYDLEYWQPTFSFVELLLGAEHERIRRGEGSLAIEIIPGTVNGFGPYKRWPNTIDECRKCLDNIVIPMCGMLPSCAHTTLLEFRRDPKSGEFNAGGKFSCAQYLSAYAAGIRPLRPLGQVNADPKLVTMTLRECGSVHWQARDSNLDQWISAAQILTSDGYRVVLVRDTSKAKERLKNLETSPNASVDLSARASLYRSSACNMFINNGPVWFALALDVPVIMFRPTCETAHGSATAVSMAASGMPTGRQIPGSPAHQRVVWDMDDAKIIVDEFRKFMSDQVQPCQVH